MIIKYNIKKFHFKKLIENIIFKEIKKNIPRNKFYLNDLHEYFSISDIPELLNKIYILFRNQLFQNDYDELCYDIKKKFHNNKTKYQSIPSVRIHMPGMKSVEFHNDMFYGHGKNVFNYWLPITKVFKTNSMYVLSENRSVKLINKVKKDKISIINFNNLCEEFSEPLEIDYGQIFKFNSKLIHGTLLNNTDHTRISIDFRMINDGDNAGLKDSTFFIKKRSSSGNKKIKKTNATLYFNREGKEKFLPSQKYQQLNCLEYCKEKNLTPIRLDTELSGFDYYPSLFHLLLFSKKEKIKDIVIYSRHNLPNRTSLNRKFWETCKKFKLRVHFVLEDEIK